MLPIYYLYEPGEYNTTPQKRHNSLGRWTKIQPSIAAKMPEVQRFMHWFCVCFWGRPFFILKFHTKQTLVDLVRFFSRKRPRRVLSKKALSLNIVIKHCLKFCWSDGCLERLSSKTAQSSAEVMAVFKDCHQRLPKVLLKWWLSLKIVIKDCPKFCWSDGCLERLSSKTAQSSAEVMAVFKDCHQRLPKVLLKWWLSSKTREKTANLRLEKKIREKTAERDC